MPLRAPAFFFCCALGGCAPSPGSSRAASAAPSGEARAAASSVSSTSPESRGPTEESDAAELESDADLDVEAESYPASPDPTMPAASRYAALDPDVCEAELGRRQVSYERVASARGVVAPVRLRGALSGVTFRSNLPEAQRKVALTEIFDCRLVLALDDFAKILAKHDVVEVIHLSVYRPAGPRAHLNGPGRRHLGALAIDAAHFKTKDGRTLKVEKDFHGRIGAKTCPPPKGASELRTIACEAGDARLFNVLLTPNYNWPHRNHFHMEVTAKVRWTIVH